MKSFDVISEPSSQLKKRTWLGGLLTLSLCAAAVVLLSKELSGYKRIEVTKNMVLDMAVKSEKVLVDFAIDLFNAPCALVSLDINDRLRHHVADVPITRELLEPGGETAPFTAPVTNAERLDAALQSLSRGAGCRLSGQLELDKVPGNFHISFHSAMNEYLQLRSLHPDEFGKLDLSYQIRTLHFGTHETAAQLDRIRGLVAELGLSPELLENYAQFKPLRMKDFRAAFWVEIIPYTLEDKRDGFAFSSYQNSFNMHAKPLVSEERSTEVPELEFNYKFSSLSVYYTVFSPSYKHLLATCLVFVGGIYSFLSIVNSALTAALRLSL